MKKKKNRDQPLELPATIEDLVAHLADCSQRLLNTSLTELNDLKDDELACLKERWPEIEPERRRQIAGRLVELAEDNTRLNFDGIFRGLLRDPDEEVRLKAVEGLWEDEEPSLVEPLARLLREDSSTQVREAAASALGKFALLAELGKLRSDTVSRLRQVLLEALDAGNPLEVRRRALEAAAPLRLPRVIEAIRAAYHSGDSRLKASAICAMGQNCDSPWLPLLLKELKSATAEMRYEAAAACGELREEAAVPHLVRLTGDSDTEVQLAAIQALGKIGGSQAKEALKRCQRHSREVIRQVAEEALEGLEAVTEPFSIKIYGGRNQGEDGLR